MGSATEKTTEHCLNYTESGKVVLILVLRAGAMRAKVAGLWEYAASSARASNRRRIRRAKARAVARRREKSATAQRPHTGNRRLRKL